MLTLPFAPDLGRNENFQSQCKCCLAPMCKPPPNSHPATQVWPGECPSPSNAQCEQFNHTNSDHQHSERDRIVVKPIVLLRIHNKALSD
jgi:hypothetical protein